MKIDRPDWYKIAATPWNNINETTLNEWFDEFVEPINKMLSEAVQVYGYIEDGKPKYYSSYTWGDSIKESKALLINIQPIKKETAEDVLREISKMEEGQYVYPSLLKRVKAVLDE